MFFLNISKKLYENINNNKLNLKIKYKLIINKKYY